METMLLAQARIRRFEGSDRRKTLRGVRLFKGGK